MPTTLGGLAIFIVFLTPGFLNYIQRKWRVPQRKLSPLVEVATFLSVSVFTNLFAIGLFAITRAFLPRHTPDVQQVLLQGTAYIFPRIGYIVAWSLGVLAVSCTVAVLIGSGVIPFDRLITPVIIDNSAWYQVFDSAPENAKIYVGCDLSDGSYVSGYLDYYNTDVDEVADRDLVLAAPIEIKRDGKTETSGFQQMILSARSMIRLSVYFEDNDVVHEDDDGTNQGEEDGEERRGGLQEGRGQGAQPGPQPSDQAVGEAGH
jgi:hypothetical protein